MIETLNVIEMTGDIINNIYAFPGTPEGEAEAHELLLQLSAETHEPTNSTLADGEDEPIQTAPRKLLFMSSHDQ